MNHLTPPPDHFSDGDVDTIGQRIRWARKAQDLNQEALASRLGVTQPTVANWEADVHNPRQLMLAKLAEALAVSLGWLAGGEQADRAPNGGPGIAYLTRLLIHVPVISPAALACLDTLDELALHGAAADFIPISARAGKYFGCFCDPGPYGTDFPGETLFVVDYARRDPVPGTYVMLRRDAEVGLHHWPDGPTLPHLSPPMGQQLGTVAITIRFF